MGSELSEEEQMRTISRVAIFDNLPDQRFTGRTIGKNYLPVTLGKILIRNIKPIF